MARSVGSAFFHLLTHRIGGQVEFPCILSIPPKGLTPASRLGLPRPPSGMGATHFLTRTLDKVRTEMSLHVLAYNIKRVIAIIGVGPLLQAIRA